MIENSATWTIEGPDGTVLTANGSDPVYVEEVTGFADAPRIRTNVEELPEEDGAEAGDFFYGERPVTFRGKLGGATPAERNQRMLNLKRAFRGLRGDVLLKSQPSGLPAMQATARLESLRFTGGYVKDFMVGLICPDPLIYSQQLHTLTASAVPPSGAAFPWSFPVVFGTGSGAFAELTLVNAGIADAPAVLRAWGEVTDPELRNDRTGETLIIEGLVLSAGEFVEVDFGDRSVVRSNGDSVYDLVTFPGSAWWKLLPGSNPIQLRGAGSGAGVTLDADWRDAWD